jgi:hypothetical protein
VIRADVLREHALVLDRLKGPIRDVKSADDLLSEEDAKNAPREVMRLVNHMMSGDGDVVSDHTLIIRNLVSAVSGSNASPFFLFYGQSNLFTTRGDPKVVEIIREV